LTLFPPGLRWVSLGLACVRKRLGAAGCPREVDRDALVSGVAEALELGDGERRALERLQDDLSSEFSEDSAGLGDGAWAAGTREALVVLFGPEMRLGEDYDRAGRNAWRGRSADEAGGQRAKIVRDPFAEIEGAAEAPAAAAEAPAGAAEAPAGAAALATTTKKTKAKRAKKKAKHKYRCPDCRKQFAKWGMCLQHVRALKHAGVDVDERGLQTRCILRQDDEGAEGGEGGGEGEERGG
jgi:hypothetical protein